MNDMPLAFKVIVNVFLYILYTVFAGIIVGIIYGRILSWKGMPIPREGDPVYTQIFIFTALWVLIVSLIFRRYFYLCSRKTKIQGFKKDLQKKLEKEKEGLNIEIQ